MDTTLNQESSSSLEWTFKSLPLCPLRSFAQLKCVLDLGYWGEGSDVFLNYGMGVGGEGMLSAVKMFQECLGCVLTASWPHIQTLLLSLY